MKEKKVCQHRAAGIQQLLSDVALNLVCACC